MSLKDNIVEGVVKSKVSEQKYLLQMIMSFLFTNLGVLNTTENRLEFFVDLPALFKVIYQSLYGFEIIRSI